MLLLFADRESEITKLSAEGEVLTVSKSHKSALLEVQLALAVDVLLVGVDTDYLRKEHSMRAEELLLDHLTFKAQGTFLDKWRRYLLRGDGMEAAKAELVRILSALYAAEVGLTAHSRGGEVYDEFPCFLDNIVGIALGAH